MLECILAYYLQACPRKNKIEIKMKKLTYLVVCTIVWPWLAYFKSLICIMPSIETRWKGLLNALLQYETRHSFTCLHSVEAAKPRGLTLELNI